MVDCREMDALQNNFKLAWKSDMDFPQVANVFCHIH